METAGGLRCSLYARELITGESREDWAVTHRGIYRTDNSLSRASRRVGIFHMRTTAALGSDWTAEVGGAGYATASRCRLENSERQEQAASTRSPSREISISVPAPG